MANPNASGMRWLNYLMQPTTAPAHPSRLALVLSSLGLLAIVGCDKGGAKLQTPSGKVTFGERPTEKGEEFRGSFTATVDVMPAADGVPSEKGHENRIFVSEYRLQVLEANRGLPTSVQIQYTGGREAILSMGDLEDDEHYLLGDTYQGSDGSYEGPRADDHNVKRVLARNSAWSR
jgi:hypothetical protein